MRNLITLMVIVILSVACEKEPLTLDELVAQRHAEQPQNTPPPSTFNPDEQKTFGSLAEAMESSTIFWDNENLQFIYSGDVFTPRFPGTDYPDYSDENVASNYALPYWASRAFGATVSEIAPGGNTYGKFGYGQWDGDNILTSNSAFNYFDDNNCRVGSVIAKGVWTWKNNRVEVEQKYYKIPNAAGWSERELIDTRLFVFERQQQIEGYLRNTIHISGNSRLTPEWYRELYTECSGD